MAEICRSRRSGRRPGSEAGAGVRREYHLITREDRLEKIAEDIVAHYMGRGVLAKAMVISIDKATAVRMYDKVQKHWKTTLAEAAKGAAAADPMDKPELEERLQFFEKTDMAVVVSSVPERNRRVQARRGWTSPRTANGW